ncbi:copper resistance protein CopD [Citricoccus sp. SGAir0253]|uniref:cytochrome c oxidase assembly protein n=1 Tax=Citricoccus sp. SGAir0253 TaxID=2567881 RepID=UPI0010CD635B|nr:cytochrome c oxidase assembly protein [Citricoccus sp. SGAir0253]QCU77250.1 copper resistance protein CopD [Citricoccus sp. SGAir0253]
MEPVTSSPTTPRKPSPDAVPAPRAAAAAATTPAGAPAWTWPVAGVVGAAVLVLAAALSGVTAADDLSDPGAFTRWGLPVAKLLHNLAMPTAIAALVFACAVLPPRRGEEEHPAFTRLMQVAALASGAWTVAALAVMLLSYSDLAGVPLAPGPSFTSGLVGYLQDISVGQAWVVVTVIAAVVTSLTLAVRSAAGLAWTALLALVALVPQALIGHSASGDDHMGAVNSIGLHLLGVVVWVGGLFVLLLLAPRLVGPDGATGRASAHRQGPEPLVYTVVSRYSVLAGLGLATVVLSGIVNAALRMDSPEQLASPYGLIVVAKLAGSLLLGLVGLMHRRWIIPRLATGTSAPAPGARRLLWQLVAVEAVVMAAIMALATVLARTAPPVPEEIAPDATPARILTGYDLPPELTGERWFTTWRLDWLWVAVIAFLALWYVWTTVRLHRRGDSWPVLRTASWLTGLTILFWVTSGAPAVYGMVLFSAHMVAHMTLTMISPLFLVLGAPVTLALRSLPTRTDGTRGPREWILWIVHSWWGRFVTHPVVAAVGFAGSILVFYYTPFFGFSLEYHLGHEFMNVHFLLTGYLFATVMIGIDPLPRSVAYPMRLVLLLATMAFHAFIGVAMTSSESLLQASWFGSTGRDWGPSAIADQQIGGAIMWGIGEVPTVIMAVVVAVMWWRSDLREAKRLDRKADLDGEAELKAWNRMYEQLAEDDTTPGGTAR